MCLGNNEGTFDVKTVYTATIASTKGHFSSQKGTFGYKLGGGAHVPPLVEMYVSSRGDNNFKNSSIFFQVHIQESL